MAVGLQRHFCTTRLIRSAYIFFAIRRNVDEDGRPFMCVFGSTISADILTEPNLQDIERKNAKNNKNASLKG